MSKTEDWNLLDEDALYREIVRRDWNIGHTAVTTYGVTLTFREHYTSDFPGMVTREFFGRNRAEAMRQFLLDFERNAEEQQ